MLAVTTNESLLNEYVSQQISRTQTSPNPSMETTSSCITACPDAVLEAEHSKREVAATLRTIFPATNNFLA